MQVTSERLLEGAKTALHESATAQASRREWVLAKEIGFQAGTALSPRRCRRGVKGQRTSMRITVRLRLEAHVVGAVIASEHFGVDALRCIL